MTFRWILLLACAALGAGEIDVWQQKADAMKAAVIAAPNFSPEKIVGTCYYLSNDGSDDNDGKSPEHPIATLEKLATLPVASGDAVFFRRGDLFRLTQTITALPCSTYSAWGVGPKPVLCGSRQNYADPALWQETQYPGIWKCTQALHNVGLITFDHDPRTVGKYDVLCGNLVPPALDKGAKGVYEFQCEPPLQLENDLDFWTDDQANCLYLRSKTNPGSRFKQIEIAPDIHGFTVKTYDVTIDNLHLTMFGRHGVSGMNDVSDLEVQNCIFDYIGGSILWYQSKTRKNVRFGNAVEVYGSCHGYRVHDNWIYQIYDTGITHQCNDRRHHRVTHENVEYWNNLIEYCYWSIEYYNQRNKYGITRNIYVHDNFCRFGGEGWGCPLRKETTPMYSFANRAEETSNYRTENNIFQFSEGYIISHRGVLEPEGCLSFRGNTYIQKPGRMFALWGEQKIPSDRASVEKFLTEVLHEKDFRYILLDNN